MALTTKIVTPHPPPGVTPPLVSDAHHRHAWLTPKTPKSPSPPSFPTPPPQASQGPPASFMLRSQTRGSVASCQRPSARSPSICCSFSVSSCIPAGLGLLTPPGWFPPGIQALVSFSTYPPPFSRPPPVLFLVYPPPLFAPPPHPISLSPFSPPPPLASQGPASASRCTAAPCPRDTAACQPQCPRNCSSSPSQFTDTAARPSSHVRANLPLRLGLQSKGPIVSVHVVDRLPSAGPPSTSCAPRSSRTWW